MRIARLGGCAAALIATAGLAMATAVSYAEPLGHTTEEQTLRPGEPIAPGSSFEQVAEGPADARVVRTLPNASAIGGRGERRHSLAYFAQLTDFQLVDEESPARVEFTDRGANSAFRPQEAFHPWAIDHSFGQLNQFTSASPHSQTGGARAPMDLAVLTGDHADNQQHNEAVWVRRGRDRVSGGGGNDDIDGGTGRDAMRGGAGDDRMKGGSGGDAMRGGSGRDRLAGQRGSALLIGGAGRDRLFGGPGRDRRRQ